MKITGDREAARRAAVREPWGDPVPAVPRPAPPDGRRAARVPAPGPGPRRPAGPLKRRRRRLRLLAARLYTSVLMSNPPRSWAAPAADGRYGPADGAPLTLLMLGDSLARSVGAGTREETLGALLAQGLADRGGRPVNLRVLARAGATTRTLHQQVARAGTLRPGLAVIIVGSNDTMLPAPIGRAARRFARVLDGLGAAGWEIVVVPCADPGGAPGFRTPVRAVASRRARRLARLQTRAAVQAGALIGPSAVDGLRDRAAELFGPDGVHPSPRGYAEYARKMLPTLLSVPVHAGVGR
ncbi:SGNH/GDSL hydrolase family protein [Streptomyces sp. CB03911]|uniref:SGNH/GDSL hydrolase family protein n=1 Tax=Streptomyces sp. CB03911 TaxID=1804758 RepID=UPI0018FEA20D|nr:SGNH/GDSL hydrolase family protein [Streptomyces sp. CB03911]